MIKTFSILGCGWLGLSLAKHIKDIYKINVSSTSSSKNKIFEELEFKSYIINDENSKKLPESFFICYYLFISIPPTKSKNYISLLKDIAKKIQENTKVIFISSTSVYPKVNQIFDENYKIEDNLYSRAENIFINSSCVIFRCSGLMGYNRVAGKYFENKTISNANVKTNYVHRDDVIKAVLFVINNNIIGVFNLCSTHHFEKKDIYDFNALKYDFKKVKFDDENILENRIISSQKLRDLGFNYLFDSSKDFI